MNKLKITNRENIIFFGVSILFILIPFLVVPNFEQQQNIFQTMRFKRMLTENILLLGFFFLNYFYLIPRIYFKKKYLFYIIALLLCFLIVYQVPEMIFQLKKDLPKIGEFKGERFRKPPPFMMWSPKILLFFCLTLISLFIRQNKSYQEVKEEKQLSEIAYLRAQINPHFLFNTLNNIYALTLQKSDYASDAVMKLSKMMRFVVSDSSKDFVSLQQDLEYIKNYIQLQQLRLVTKNSILFEIIGNPSNLKISPLLLINFIENAFKYGVIDDKNNPIKINLEIVEQVLTLKVENLKSDEEFSDEEKSEIGISNSKKRLNYIYADRYQLSINETVDRFFVELKLELND